MKSEIPWLFHEMYFHHYPTEIPTTSTISSAVWPNNLTLEIPIFSSSAPISHCHPMNLKILFDHSESSNRFFVRCSLPQCLDVTVVPLSWQTWSNLPFENNAKSANWFLGRSTGHRAHKAIIISQKSEVAQTFMLSKFVDLLFMNQVAVKLLLVCNLLPCLGIVECREPLSVENPPVGIEHGPIK